MAQEYKYYFVTYEEARALIKILDWVVKSDLWKDVRERAGRIKRALEDVRNIDYGSTRGHQIILTPKDAELFEEIWNLYDQGILD